MPTAPPWWASVNGHLEGVRLINLSSHTAFLYDKVSPNAVAAMPSLHAAYPWLFFLFACRLWGKRGAPVVLYPLAVFFAVVYLGHHYVIDVIGGVVYASASYALVCVPVGEWLLRSSRQLMSRISVTIPGRRGQPVSGEQLPARP